MSVLARCIAHEAVRASVSSRSLHLANSPSTLPNCPQSAELDKPVGTMLMALDEKATCRGVHGSFPRELPPRARSWYPPWTCFYCEAQKMSENGFEGVLQEESDISKESLW